MFSASRKWGLAASLAILSGCSTAGLGLDLGAKAGLGSNLKVVVDSLGHRVDLRTLPAMATRVAQALTFEEASKTDSALTIGMKGDTHYADPARGRTLLSLGFSTVSDLAAKTDAAAQAGLSSGSASAGLSLGLSASASGSAGAGAGGSGSASGGSSGPASGSSAGSAGGSAGGSASLKADGWTFQKIEFKPTHLEVHTSGSASGSGWVEIPTSSTGSIDLVKLNEQGAAAFMGSAKLEAGHYDAIRLWGADTKAAVESSANTYLAVDSQGTAHTGVYKLPGEVMTVNGNFDVKSDSSTEVKMSFDANGAMKKAGDQLVLDPSSVTVESSSTATAQAKAEGKAAAN